MHNAFLGVKPAVIEWRHYGSEKHQWIPASDHQLQSSSQVAPYSPAFDDIYYNPQDGIAESTHVFLEGNDLAKRFTEHHQASSTAPFKIFETGFGTGLNFLLTAKLWQQSSNSNSHSKLHYWSVEQFPISPEDLRRVYQILGIESEHTEQLLEHYPDALPGVHEITIAENITLHLLFYPIEKALKEVALPEGYAFDAWYLDGFAPSKNPDMWAKSLLHFMVLHSARGTSLSTFTVAAALRKPLPHYGFEIEKRPGFGRKRDMLTARFTEKTLSTPRPTLATNYITPRPQAQKVAIVGAGLAGCALAHVLHQEGIEAHLYDANGVCSGASNMPSLVGMPVMSIDHNAYSQLTFEGYRHLHRYLTQNPELAQSHFAHQLSNAKYSQFHLEQYQNIYGQQCWHHDKAWFQFQTIELSAENSQTQNLKALKIPAFQVNGKAFCQHLISHLPSEQLHLKTSIRNAEQLEAFNHIVIASGYQSPHFHWSKSLPQIAPMRGQLTTLKAHINHQTPINYDGHIAHCHNQLVIGATFDNSADDSVQRDSSLLNIEQVNQRFGLNFNEKDIIGEHPGVRATSYDRFPFCGYFDHNQEQTLWLNYGFGARGLCYSMLCAEVITNAILGKPSPLPKTILSRLSPLRV
ncbi:tRNA (5-methylaminomethyl-2-thiouridine)(34)-methyltransferase MnmD [Kangiella marina]|uniref:Bifunctional tRNA (5-methylaminomethyl-2-thiouridine)(34)-methyltransferase MnmD/FAD-dependent 5-carboxymethylaminomethyl-2-thiouridine(34) oxidoreductase MnmC n=1 Tax=Kangiella marina TaxID=1079178 RepID=A0ABP8ICZ3_9GAMM